ncbi:MAG TPA: ABC transporter permease [Thermodesulfobacteriota bacterium]|nr:ABC transporter permease [Thermodesulfobacteriota bacterium]
MISYWLTHIVNGLSFGMLLFVLAAGLSLIFGLCRIVNLSHGSFYLLGGYIGFSTVRFTGNFLLAVLLSMLSMAILGILTERFLLRRFRVKPLAQVLLTFGLIFVFQDAALWIWGGAPILLKKLPILTGATNLFGFYYPTYRLLILLIGLVILFFLWWLLIRTRLGVFIRAAVDDGEMANGVGIRMNFLMTMAFGFGTLLTGLAGSIGAPFLGVYPGLDIEVLLYAMAVVIVGGLGSLKGSFLGALMVGLVDSMAKALWPETGMFSMFALMAIVLILKPTGLFGLPVAPPSHASVSEEVFLEALPSSSGLLPGSRGRGWIIAGCLVVAGLVCPTVLSTYYVRLFTLALIWAIFAMSLDLILGLGGIISLGHAVFFGISAYAIGLSARFLTPNPFLQIALALFVSAFAALVLGWLLLRSRGVYFMMLTIAFSQVFRAISHSWRSVTGGGDGLSGFVRPLWMTSVETFYYFALFVFVAVFLFLRFFVKSRVGISLIGIRESEKRMTSLGYPVDRIKLLSFVVSGGLGGIAGLLNVYFNGYVSPDYFSMDTSAQAIIMIILGGAGTLIGPILGSFFVVYMQNILSAVMERWTLVLGILFILVVIGAPAGVVGLWKKQWHKFSRRTLPS